MVMICYDMGVRPVISKRGNMKMTDIRKQERREFDRRMQRERRDMVRDCIRTIYEQGRAQAFANSQMIRDNMPA